MLVGREPELEILREGLAALGSTNGSLVLLAGEPGIGKTRLASELASAARERGSCAAWGRCWEAGGAPAFWPWREACAALGIEFPQAVAVATNDAAEARFALFCEVTRLLSHAASVQPLLLVLEDLHAADPSTLLLLEFVADRLRNMPALILGTYRDLEASTSQELSGSIARLGRAGRVLQLARLTLADVRGLVRDGLENADEPVVARVFEMTQGNPLFVAEVVRDLRAHGQHTGLPLGVREVIRQRLAPLSLEERAVLEACAVLGVEFATAPVLRMVEVGAATVEGLIQRWCVAKGGERWRFTHALYREALYYDLPLARRQVLHLAAARALAASDAPLAELAHHLLESGPAAASAAIDRAIAAASQAADGFAFEDALALLERARAAIPTGPLERELRCRVLIALGETRIRSGDAAGRATCTEAAALARELGDAALLARAGLAYGTAFLMGGVDPVLVSLLDEALARLPGGDSSLRACTMARLAAARQPSPPAERPRDIELGLAAISMARRSASPRELLGVLHAASGVLYGKVHPTIRMPIAREQERLAEELGDMNQLLQARVRLAIDHLEQGDFAGYEALAASYEQLAARLGPAAAPWRVPLMRSMRALASDQFEASARWQLEARRIDAGQARARRAQAFHRIGFLRAAERHAELRAAIPELRGLWLQMPYGTMLADARVAQVLARVGADDELRELLAHLPHAAPDEEINAAWLVDAVWATADAALAKRIEPALVDHGERWNMYWFDCEIADAPSSRSLAYVAAVLDRWAECDRWFARALASAEAVGRGSLVARMCFELGDLLRRKGREPERARTLLLRALARARAIPLPELSSLIERRHPDLQTPTHAAAPLELAFSMTLEGEYYAIPAASGTLRFKANTGMRYLALLVARPHADVHVLELVGSADHPDRGDAGVLLDPSAFAAYRKQLGALRAALDDAEALGDGERAGKLREQMENIASEITRGTTRSGRGRRAPSAVDRARSAVQRRIKDALDRIGERDPELAKTLRRSVRTGIYCSYHPQ